MRETNLQTDYRRRASKLDSSAFSRQSEEEVNEKGFSNPSRTALNTSLHKDLNIEDLVSSGIQNKIGLGSELLINQPWQSTREIFKSMLGNGKDAFSRFSNNDSDPNVVRFKKYGMLGLAALFVVFAVQSSVQLFGDFWAGKQTNKVIHLGDIFVKWMMGAGLWATALGKAGSLKFQGLNPVLWGSGISLLLSQLKGISGGQNNLLAKATKLTGVDKQVKDSINGLGIVPRFLGL